MKAMVWKEIREIWGVWGWAMLLVLVLTMLMIGQHQSTLGDLIGLVQTGFIVMYCAFCGARSFAGEHVRETHDYLVTRAISPRRILLTKYIIGLLQTQILAFLFTFFSELAAWKYLFHSVEYGFESLDIFIFLSIFAIVYTWFFIISIFIKDILRSFIIGIGSMVVFIPLIYVAYHADIFKLEKDNLLTTLYLSSITLTLVMVLVGLMGVAYYSMYRKRLVWKTGFLIMFPLSALLWQYSQYCIYGDMKPKKEYPEVQFPWTHYFDTSGQLYHWNQKVYGFTNLPKVQSYQLEMFDLDRGNSSVSQSILKFPKYTNIGYTFFNQGRLYYIDHPWVSQPEGRYLESLGKGSTEYLREHRPDAPRLVIYDLEKQKELARIAFVSETARLNMRQFYFPIMVQGDKIIVSYGISTFVRYKDQYGKFTTAKTNWNIDSWKYRGVDIDKNTFQVTRQYIVNTADYNAIYNRHSYQYSGKYEFQVAGDDRLIHVYDKSHPDSIVNVHTFDWRTENDFIMDYKVNENRMYVYTMNHPLEVFDISDMQHPIKLYAENYHWLDANVFRNREYWYGHQSMTIVRNRIILFYPRGILVYDITDSSHPKLVGKMNRDRILSWYLDKNDLYINGEINGLSVYKIM